MLESIKNIFHKKSDIIEKKSLTLSSLPDWLSQKEEACTSHRNEIYKQSRADLLQFEKELKDLLNEFKEDPALEPQHHKVEQVNRHALPQFIKKIESELKEEFSDDDDEFYKEIAELISGCFAAYRGPGRYLHHLYPEEVKDFRLTLDQMGKELNRMTDVMRISRERLVLIYNVRDALSEREDLLEEWSQSVEEERSIDTGYHEGLKHVETLKESLKHLEENEEFLKYEKREERCAELEKTLKEKREVLDSSIRTAVHVWKRAERAFSDKKSSDEVKAMEELIRIASSTHRDDEELLNLICKTSGILFSLFQSGVLEARNSFEKSLFSNEEQYTDKFTGLIEETRSSLKEMSVLQEELEKSEMMKKKEKFLHDIREDEHEISSMKMSLEKLTERKATVKEKINGNLITLKEKFTELKEESFVLDLPEGMDGR
jgi:hypothetical protein